MTSALHRLIVEASQGRDDLAIDRANYLTAWQLSLDGNLPGETRKEWAALAEVAGYRIIDFLRLPTWYGD